MNKNTEQDPTQAFLKKMLDDAVDEAADAITWTDTDIAGKKRLTPEEAKEEFKKSLRIVLDNKKAYERTDAGFKLILEHIGEYPNDRLCLKELANAANCMRKNLEDVLGPNLEKTSESLTADIDLKKLHKKLETSSMSMENPPPPPSIGSRAMEYLSRQPQHLLSDRREIV